jgi:hypothetical protein
MEYVSAHATYRFVVRDDEDGRARILVSRPCLFCEALLAEKLGPVP